MTLALLGQACALGLIYAPNFGILQHYLPWGEVLSSGKGLFLTAPLFQTAMVTYAGWRFRRTALSTISGMLSKRQAAVLLVFAIVLAANGSFQVQR